MWTIIILVLFVVAAVVALAFAMRLKPAKRPNTDAEVKARDVE